MSNGNNDVVMIDLDRPRQLRFGHKALKQLVALTGMNIDDLDTSNLDLGEIEKFLYCGLLSDAKSNGESLRLEDMEDLLDQAPSFSHIVEKMTEAFNVSFGSFGEQVPEGNSQELAEKPAAVSGTGKKV
ncbi:hypothetical protein [Cohnella sp. AR92]|uniref:hypothetical protein n=1 Tax=Cohnella sp. AR92 TaxID=648716 RepID=UPI001863A956|nr:hypothetical protein [Cohnella sp. AR92]